MPTYYCSTAGCGNRISYLTEKPTSCPKCGKGIADPMKTALAAAKTVVKAPQVDDLDDDDSIIPPVRSAKSKPIVRKPVSPRSRSIQASEAEEEDNTEEADEEVCDPREVRRLARELAASIDPSTISVGLDGGDGDRVTFKQWCASK